MAAPGNATHFPLARLVHLTAVIGAAETLVAHGGSTAPDIVLVEPVNAAVRTANQTQAPNATNVFVIASAAATSCRVTCIWLNG